MFKNKQEVSKIRTPLFQGIHWSFFAVSEGTLKTLQLWIFKLIGITVVAVPVMFIAIFVVGVIQMIGGLIINRRSRYEVFPGIKYITGSLLFGAVSVYMIALPIYVFSLPNVDFSLFAFVIVLAVIPGALVDKFIFKDSFGLSKLFAIFLFLFGVYAFLDFPSFEQIASLPVWIWFAFTLPVAALINEFIMRSLKVDVISPWVNNFWIGVSTVVVCGIVLLVLEPISSLSRIITDIPQSSWILFSILGVLILSGIFAKQRTYMHGGTIASKKILMTSTYLITAFLVGLVVFSDVLTVGKVVGILTLIGAYVLIEPHIFSRSKSNID